MADENNVEAVAEVQAHEAPAPVAVEEPVAAPAPEPAVEATPAAPSEPAPPAEPTPAPAAQAGLKPFEPEGHPLASSTVIDEHTDVRTETPGKPHMRESLKASKDIGIKPNVSFMKPGEVAEPKIMQSPSVTMKKVPETPAPRPSSDRYSRLSKDKRRSSSKIPCASLMSIKRGSFTSYTERQKAPKFMNTYKLNSEKPFNVDKVQSILVEVLQETIEETMTYDPEICPTKAKWASNVIRSRVKEQEYDRYKLICLVTIGEKKTHDMLSCVRFLWDSERDRFATYMHENMHVFAVASVFGLYYE